MGRVNVFFKWGLIADKMMILYVNKYFIKKPLTTGGRKYTKKLFL